MLSRTDRIKRAKGRIIERAVGIAFKIGRWWGVPPEDAAAALTEAAACLRERVAGGQIHWPAEEARRVSNGTPDEKVHALAGAVLAGAGGPVTQNALLRSLRAQGVRRRREDLCRLAKPTLVRSGLLHPKAGD